MNTYCDHLGKKFDTQRQMCEYWHINRKTYAKRISKGWSIEKALTTPVKSVINFVYTDHKGNTFNSLDEMCAFWNIDKNVYTKRIKVSHISKEKALTMPLRASEHIEKTDDKELKNKVFVDFNGNKFNTLDDMCKAYGIDEETYNRRIKKGWNEKEALLSKYDNRIKFPYSQKLSVEDYKGNKYISVKAMCKVYGITQKTFRQRLLCGLSEEAALNSKIIDHKGNEFENISELCEFWHISINTFKKLLAKNLSIKDIIETNSRYCFDNLYKDYKGKEYSSLSQMCKAYNVNLETFLSRLEVGWELKECLCGKLKANNNNSKIKNYEVTDHLGNVYPTLGDMCDTYNISIGTFNSRVKQLGWSLEEALTQNNAYINIKSANKYDDVGIATDHLGNKFRSLKEMCSAYNIPVVVYKRRLKEGIIQEKALTIPYVYAKAYSTCEDGLGIQYSSIKEMCKAYNVSYEVYRQRRAKGLSVQDALVGNTKAYKKSLIKDANMKLDKFSCDELQDINKLLDKLLNKNKVKENI